MSETSSSSRPSYPTPGRSSPASPSVWAGAANASAGFRDATPEQTSDALGTAGSQIGPHAKSLAIWLHYALGLSFAKTAGPLGRLGVPVTAGAISTASQATGTDLVPVQAGIIERVNQAPMVVMNETSWRVGGESAWLWAAVSEDATAYHVADGRGFDEATVLVDEDYHGSLVRDGWAVYRRYSYATHQTCTAHLLRRCEEMISDGPDWARGTPRQVQDILHTALDARDLPEDERRTVAADLAERIELLAEQAHPHDANRRLVGHLANEADALFTFLHHPGIDVTNWRPSWPSDLPSSIARSGVATAPGEERPARAGS
jgi:transposase